ncbi:uncharacterized protein [Rutidosis leptorrhynchoides]|uniref:uncharacterized protein n=1 Tax=Rutidosis leptorrhynchoides TaxID=125765 RepID=UPI003A9A4656
MSIVSHTGKEGNVPFQCPTLTATNYTTWAIRVEAILDAHGLWESIETPVGMTVDEKQSKLARAFLFQTVPEDVLLQVAKNKTAKEVWESLKTCYLGADRVQKTRLHTLKSEFEGLRMKDSESIDEFAGKLSGMLSKYTSLGATLEDSVLSVASIEQYADVDKMPFEEAICRLKAYEDRLNLRSSNSNGENSLLLAKSDTSTQKNSKSDTSSGGRGRGSTNNDRGGRNGGCGRGRGRGGSNYQKTKDKRHIKCFNCENYGHYTSECKNQEEENDEANLSAT